MSSGSADSKKVLCLSNRLETYTWEYLYKNSDRTKKVVGAALQSGGIINITPAETVPTAAEWKAQLAAWNEDGNPLTVIYYTSNTREEELDVFDIPTFRGTTIYEIDTQVSTRLSGEYKRME